MTTPATIFASSAADITLDRVRQLVDQNLPEGLTLEYKEDYSTSIVKSVAAMANSYGGIILVGVTDGPDTDRLVGVGQDSIVQIINACHDSLEPPWEPEIIPVSLDGSDDRLVLVVRIDPARAPRPILIGGSAPVRLQGRNAVADRNRLAVLFADTAATVDLTWQVLQAPMLPLNNEGTPEADLIFRSGFWIPVGAAANWRPLSEGAVSSLKEALNGSALAAMLMKWTGQLGIQGLNPFDLRGLNRARRTRLVWQAVRTGPVPHPVEAVAELVMPESYGAPAVSMSFTVDVILRLRASVEGAWGPSAPAWRMPVADLYTTIDSLLAGLTGDAVVHALADLAGVETILIPQPRSLHLVTGPAIDELMYLEMLRPVQGSGGSHGASLLADPTLDLADATDRHGQVDAWIQQIALDAGLRGMERLLNALRDASQLPT